MTRFGLGVEVALEVPSLEMLEAQIDAAQDYHLGLGFWIGDGPTQVMIGPTTASEKTPISIMAIVEGIAKMVGLESELGATFRSLKSNEPWASVFNVAVNPYLTVQVTGKPSVELVLKLFGKDGKYGLHLPPPLPPYIKVEPSFTVYDLIVSYNTSRG